VHTSFSLYCYPLVMSTTATLFLDNNAFVGDIPEELYLLTGLSRLQISNNTGLTGNISSGIGAMSNLTTLVASNTSLSGSIPESLFSLTKLQYLDLHMANFNGGLSQSFSNLNELGSVMLSNNSFSGSIPSGFAELSFLSKFLILHW
jgi:Leucine-rich repeat (LRR) protein